MAADLNQLSEKIAACRICFERPDGNPLPHEPRPVCVLSSKAKIRIIGQAPGTRVHASGRPFTDPSGDRLRDWLGVTEEQFYNPDLFSITPMGFCFPGLDAKGGDLPPRKECAREWHDLIDAAVPQIKLTLLIGQYAHRRHISKTHGKGVTEIVQNWRAVLSENEDVARFALPHPSWRNNAWLKRNPWFEEDLLPVLKKQVAQLM